MKYSSFDYFQPFQNVKTTLISGALQNRRWAGLALWAVVWLPTMDSSLTLHQQGLCLPHKFCQAHFFALWTNNIWQMLRCKLDWPHYLILFCLRLFWKSFFSFCPIDLIFMLLKTINSWRKQVLSLSAATLYISLSL